eukprot:INCI10444.3.p1 GENE.INCI10444.3~~INCI10444.3.p1  ORF type:complete len:1090 (-),score=221.25 INCI10444.3:69-3338(-)
MGNEGSTLDSGDGPQRVEVFDPLCVWKGRLHKTKIRKNWQSRMFFLCHNTSNDDMFFVYFTDAGIARYFIDLRKSFITHDPERQIFLVSTLGDDLGGAQDSDDDEDDSFADRESEVWVLRYDDAEQAAELRLALGTLGLPIGEVLLHGWLEKRSRKGNGPIRRRASLAMLPARKRYALLLSCGDLIYFKDIDCQSLRGRLFLPTCSKIYCEDDKFATDASDAYVIVIQAITKQMLLKVLHTDTRVSITDNFTLWMKKMVPLVLNKMPATGTGAPRPKKKEQDSGPESPLFRSAQSPRGQLPPTPNEHALSDSDDEKYESGMQRRAHDDINAINDNGNSDDDDDDDDDDGLGGDGLDSDSEDNEAQAPRKAKPTRGNRSRTTSTNNRSTGTSGSASSAAASNPQVNSSTVEATSFIDTLRRTLNNEDKWRRFRIASNNFKKSLIDVEAYCLVFCKLFKKKSIGLIPGLLEMVTNKQIRRDMKDTFRSLLSEWKQAQDELDREQRRSNQQLEEDEVVDRVDHKRDEQPSRPSREGQRSSKKDKERRKMEKRDRSHHKSRPRSASAEDVDAEPVIESAEPLMRVTSDPSGRGSLLSGVSSNNSRGQDPRHEQRKKKKKKGVGTPTLIAEAAQQVGKAPKGSGKKSHKRTPSGSGALPETASAISTPHVHESPEPTERAHTRSPSPADAINEGNVAAAAAAAAVSTPDMTTSKLKATGSAKKQMMHRKMFANQHGMAALMAQAAAASAGTGTPPLSRPGKGVKNRGGGGSSGTGSGAQSQNSQNASVPSRGRVASIGPDEGRDVGSSSGRRGNRQRSSSTSARSSSKERGDRRRSGSKERGRRSRSRQGNEHQKQDDKGVDDGAVARFATTLFQKLDKDNSGSVEIKEMKFFLRKVVGLGDKDECRKVATAMMHLANDGGPVSKVDFVELIKNIVGSGIGGGKAAVEAAVVKSLKKFSEATLNPGSGSSSTNSTGPAATVMDSTTDPVDETEEAMNAIADMVTEWAAGKDIMGLLQTIPTIMPERCERMNYKVPVSIASMKELSKAWRQGVLCCHPDKQGVDASVVTKHLAERVFDTVKGKYQEAKDNLQSNS